MRLVFMGTPCFAVPTLQRLLSSSHQVLAVFTQSDKPSGRGEKISIPPIKTLAMQHGIPVYQPEKLKAEEWKPVCESIGADSYVVVAYGKLLPTWLIDLPLHGALNLHASLLPKYRGAAPINWAVANGEVITGVTIMKIDAGLDTGDVLLQEEAGIGPQETAADVHDHLAALGAELMIKTLDLLEKGQLVAHPQDHRLATYAAILKKSDGLIDWNRTSQEISNRVRGFNPWPGTFTYWQGCLLRIWKASPVQLNMPPLSPGTLVHHPSMGAVVFCREGQLQVAEFQLENRKKVPAADFLNGIRLSSHQTVLLGK